MPYDLPALLFAALGLLLLYDGKLGWYYLLLPVATLNRETAALLVVVFWLTYFCRMREGPWVLHLVLQLAIVLAVKTALFEAFAENSGSVAGLIDHDTGRSRLVQNLEFLMQPRAYLACGGMWLPFLIVLPFLRDPFFRRAVWAAPMFMGGMFLLGKCGSSASSARSCPCSWRSLPARRRL